jgi:hypothetical protein
MTAAYWGQGVWGVDTWLGATVVPPDPGTAPPTDVGTGQPPGTGYSSTAGRATIEIGVSMSITQLIDYQPPPPQIVPLRNYRSVMNDFRVLSGRPVAAPVLDVSVPVTVSVGTTQVPLPDLTRALPPDIDTLATLRWIADNDFVVQSADGNTLWWWDTTGAVAWSAYDTFQPLYADDYSYLIPKPHTAEVLLRPAMVFEAALGSCMNTSVSTSPVSGAQDVEFLMVVWSHPLAAGMQASSILDSGGQVSGGGDMPFAPGDMVSGMRQGLQRFNGGLVMWQDDVGFQMWWAQVSSGRPVLARVRFGVNPLIECWGPSGVHMLTTELPQPLEGLATNYVLGRLFNQVSAATNAGMHLMEISYYDHPIADADLAVIVQALDSCYAVSA